MTKVNTYAGSLPVVDVVRSSSRYDRSIASFTDAVQSYIDKQGVTIHDGSEVSSAKREKALRSVAANNNWGVVTGDRSFRDDSYIMWDRVPWACLEKTTMPIRTGKVWSNGKWWPKNAAALVVLEDRMTGHRLVFTAGHPPSGVEKAGSLARRTARGAAWVIEVTDQKMQANKYARKWQADGVIVSNDWNVDAKKKANRATIKTIMPRWKFAVRAPFEAGGTLGRRWIDFLMFRGALRLVKKAWLLSDDGSSDHQPTRSRLQFTKRPRNLRGTLPPSGGIVRGPSGGIR